jgi:ABC-type uncharacterized transport system auxiliary subunit
VNRRVFHLLLTLALGGCAATATVPEDRFFRVNPVHPRHVLSQPALTGGLAVDYMQADPLRSGRAVLYSDSRQPLQLQRYHYEFWVDQPPRMVHQALTSYLRETGVADNVVDGDSRAESGYRLGTRLLKFEQVLDQGSTGVEVAIEATLSSGPSYTPLWTRVYVQGRSSDSRKMHDMAIAMQAALDGLFADLQTDLAAAGSQTR